MDTAPSANDVNSIPSIACAQSSIATYSAIGQLMVSPLIGQTTHGVILVEHGRSESSYTLEGSMIYLLTGRILDGKTQLALYGILVLHA